MDDIERLLRAEVARLEITIVMRESDQNKTISQLRDRLERAEILIRGIGAMDEVVRLETPGTVIIPAVRLAREYFSEGEEGG